MISVTGRARKLFSSGKLFGARQTMAPPMTFDSPHAESTCAKYTIRSNILQTLPPLALSRGEISHKKAQNAQDHL
jgi:hypothetical protein